MARFEVWLFSAHGQGQDKGHGQKLFSLSFTIECVYLVWIHPGLDDLVTVSIPLTVDVLC